MTKLPTPAPIASVTVSLALLMAHGCAPAEPFAPPGAEAGAEKGGQPSTGSIEAFNPRRILSDRAFADRRALRALQETDVTFTNPVTALESLYAHDDLTFLQNQPGVAETFLRLGRDLELNPLLLLAMALTEEKLHGKGAEWSRTLFHACQCGEDRGPCPDSCMAKPLKDAFDVAVDRAPGGELTMERSFYVGSETLMPQNRGTYAIYKTLEPNEETLEALWHAFRRVSELALYREGLEVPFNEGWIGGACDSQMDCYFSGAECQAGTCTMKCPSTNRCPDREGPGWAVTFCATSDGEGKCMAMCASDLTEGGCGGALTCVENTPRHEQSGVRRDVCHLDGAIELNQPASFDKNLLMTDRDFENWTSVGETFEARVTNVRTLLDPTAYGVESALVNEGWDGEDFAWHLIRATDDKRLNPLMLLALAQQQQGALGWPASYTNYANYLFGCDCNGGGSNECTGHSDYRGHEAQLACAVDTLRRAFDAADSGQATLAGIRVGASYRTPTGERVTPANAATATLYTYTPYISSNRMYDQVWRKITSDAERRLP